MGEKVFVSWSGGKDSYLALLKGQEQGLQVETLLTFTGKDGQSKSHGLGPGLLSRQAAALGIPLEKEPVTWETYAEGFRRAVKRLKGRGITGGIFGDIHLEPHREWVEGICAETGLSPHLPLWGMAEKEVLGELLERGVRMVIVFVRHDIIDESWLGKAIDGSFLLMCEEAGISPCGEEGEFHTLVVDGPLFQAPLPFDPVEVKREENRSLLQS